MNTAETLFRVVSPGDWVIATAKSEYRFLIGKVKAIDKLGTPDHDTDNETDDIHVDFTAFNYPPERIAEIEEHFSNLYAEKKFFVDIALDDVIMASGMLISISHISPGERARMGNLRHNCEAFCACFPGASLPQNKKHGVLMDLLAKNMADYRKSLARLSADKLIEKAGDINAVQDAYSYMCVIHHFDDEELEFFLGLQNPLKTVADQAIDQEQYSYDIRSAMEALRARIE